MVKYIDADKLAIDLQLYCDTLCPYTKAQRGVMCRACLLGSAIDAIEDQPAVDVQEVRRGRNLDAEYSSLFECSVCHWSCWDTLCGDTSTYNYCPNCGAKIINNTKEQMEK